MHPPCLARCSFIGELPDVQGLKAVSFLGPLAQMVDRDAACAKAVMALCAEITVEVASSEATAGGMAGAKHKKVGRSLVRSLSTYMARKQKSRQNKTATSIIV